MRFMLEYPIHSDADGGAWIDPANIAEFARVAEESGIDGLALTDHPAPSKKWLTGGGHETFDPFTGLAFMAAVTSRVRLMTYLAVVPYRNPLLLAKSMTSVDVLSGGRATFVLGTGYLRSEFAALGVDFNERNELFDEAVDVLRSVWATDELHYQGRHFSAYGVTLKPAAVQKPHPPLWLGGNARVVRERAAAWGQGWAPLLGGPQLIQTARTSSIETDEQLAALIREIGDAMEAAGRDRSTLDVACGGTRRLGPDASAEERLDYIGRLSEIGVTWMPVHLRGETFAAALDELRAFGEAVAAKAR